MWRKETEYKNFFYRYRHFDDDNCLRSIELLLVKNKMYLSSPLSFNDPYDCRPHYLLKATDRETRTYLKTLFRERMVNTTKNDVNRQVAKILNRLNRKDTNLGEIFNQQYESLLQGVGILCFAKSPDNILLWSHYASSHTGVCFQFEASLNVTSFLLCAQEVIYTKDFPVINTVRASDEEKLAKGLLTKADDWTYEQEYRVIFPAEQKLVTLPDEALKAVIFGLRTANEHKELVTNLIKRRKVKPAIYQAVMKPGKYGLNFVEAKGT